MEPHSQKKGQKYTQLREAELYSTLWGSESGEASTCKDLGRATHRLVWKEQRLAVLLRPADAKSLLTTTLLLQLLMFLAMFWVYAIHKTTAHQTPQRTSRQPKNPWIAYIKMIFQEKEKHWNNSSWKNAEVRLTEVRKNLHHKDRKARQKQCLAVRLALLACHCLLHVFRRCHTYIVYKRLCRNPGRRLAPCTY